MVAAVRARLRRRDRLYRLSRFELLVIAPDTRAATLNAIAAEVREDVARLTGPDEALVTVTEGGGRSADEVLKHLRDPRAEQLDEIEMTVDSFVLR
jgi:GGDEF domain-containing protein